MIDNVIEITIIDGNGKKIILPKIKTSKKIQKKIKIDKKKFRKFLKILHIE